MFGCAPSSDGLLCFVSILQHCTQSTIDESQQAASLSEAVGRRRSQTCMTIAQVPAPHLLCPGGVACGAHTPHWPLLTGHTPSPDTSLATTAATAAAAVPALPPLLLLLLVVRPVVDVLAVLGTARQSHWLLPAATYGSTHGRPDRLYLQVASTPAEHGGTVNGDIDGVG
jgi:hypothetical protein